jgi:hypothetical protein
MIMELQLKDKRNLEKVPGKIQQILSKKAAVLGTSHVMRKVPQYEN